VRSGAGLNCVANKPVLVLGPHSYGAPGAPAAAGADAHSSQAVAPPASGPGGLAEPRTPRARWPFAVVPLAALAALGLWLLSRVEPRGKDDLALQIAAVEQHNAELENRIAQLRSRPAQFECVAAPAPAPAPPPASQAEAPPPRDPYREIEQRIAAAGHDCAALRRLLDDPGLHAADPRAAALQRQIAGTLAGSCRERLIADAKNLCPGVRPKEFSPQLVIVFDASKSMKLSLLATLDDMREADRLEPQNQQRRLQGLPEIEGPGFREPRRITAAKEAAESVVRQMPSDASIGLVMVEACPAARGVGFFAPERRAALLSQIRAIQPIGSTPLADGIAKAGQMLDGVNRESIMLVVSDGVESCGSDPCAVAQSLHATKPHLKINVVDIMGAGAGSCLARSTGGTVYTARSAAEIAATTRRAAQDALGPANCTSR
jgi:Mg-chelatase subunit ChlD